METVPKVDPESITVAPAKDSFVSESRITPVIVPFANEPKLMAINRTMNENCKSVFFIEMMVLIWVIFEFQFNIFETVFGSFLKCLLTFYKHYSISLLFDYE